MGSEGNKARKTPTGILAEAIGRNRRATKREFVQGSDLI
jgi:hypothetical protein